MIMNPGGDSQVLSGGGKFRQLRCGRLQLGLPLGNVVVMHVAQFVVADAERAHRLERRARERIVEVVDRRADHRDRDAGRAKCIDRFRQLIGHAIRRDNASAADRQVGTVAESAVLFRDFVVAEAEVVDVVGEDAQSVGQIAELCGGAGLRLRSSVGSSRAMRQHGGEHSCDTGLQNVTTVHGCCSNRLPAKQSFAAVRSQTEFGNEVQVEPRINANRREYGSECYLR
jgi:hypothetical protein